MSKQYSLRNQYKKLDDDAECQLGTFHAMMRQVIIDQLTQKGGLQVKISQSGRLLICRLRAPIKMLEMQADIENYKLQFRGEIDPGSKEFWNYEVSRLVPVEDADGNNSNRKQVVLKAIEIDEEKVEYDRKKGDEILDKLYKLSKIGPGELGISPHEEKTVMRNRRIHALERIADKVPIWNKYPAYAPFETDAHKRYIFQQYQGVRGKSFFQVKDRLYLTKTLLDRKFNFSLLENEGIVKMLIPLHDANRGEPVSNDTLYMRWAMFWTVDANLVGSPLVTSAEYNPDKPIAFYWRPFSQPLGDIRAYFGEKVALYYAWFGHYTYYLLFPMIMSFAVWILVTFFFPEHAHGGAGGEVDFIAIAMAVFITTWVVYYNKTWEEQSLAISHKWGTRGFEDVQKDRPNFVGVDGDKKYRTFVDNKDSLFFPVWRRRGLQLFSAVVILLCIIIVVCVNLLMFFELRKTRIVEKMASGMDSNHPQAISSFAYLLYALLVPVFTFLFPFVADPLNDLENYRTDVEYEDALITKHLAFQVFNNFTAIFFVAFAKKPLFNDCVEGDCIKDIRELLICIFLLRYAVLIAKTLWPYLAKVQTRFLTESFQTDDDSIIDHERIFYLDEIYRSPYDSPFHDYADTCIQFGFVVLFCAVVPLIATLALVENLIKMRLDATRLCLFLRRPHVELAEDVGMWASLMNSISTVAFVVNTAVIVYTSNAYNEVPPMKKALYFLIGEQILMVYTIILAATFPSVPGWLDDIDKRNEYIIDKYLHGVDEDDDEKLTFSKIGDPADPVDTDRLTLKAVQNKMCKSIPKLHYSVVVEIDKDRRNVAADLYSLKTELQKVSQIEFFNAYTGMGENKQGIPMGDLSITILDVEIFNKKGKKLKHNDLALKVDVYKQEANEVGTYETALSDVNGVNPPPRLYGNYDTDFHVVTRPENRALFECDIVPFSFINTLKCKAVFSLYDSNHCFIGYGEELMDDLLHQEERKKTIEIIDIKKDSEALPHLRAAADIKDGRVVSKVTTKMKFSYTKLMPLKEKITARQIELREKEKIMAHLQLGGEKLNKEWYESVVNSSVFNKFSKPAKDAFVELGKEHGIDIV